MPNRGRVSAEKLAKARETTYEMAARRCKTRDIAEEVGFTHKTVRGWIREGKASGELVIRPGRDIVIEMTRENRPVEEIQAATNYSLGHIRNIQLELRGEPLKKSPRPKENVEKFLADPAAHLGKPFTQTSPFAKALLNRCLTTTDNDPAAGLVIIEPAIELFATLAEVRKDEARDAVLCRLLQARGIKAHGLSEIGQHSASLTLIEGGYRLIAGRCPACGADYRRRHGLALGYLAYDTGLPTAWDRAIANLIKAIDLYRNLIIDDHDLHGNGIAHCYLDLSTVRFYAVGAEPSAQDARTGISLLNADTSEALGDFLLHSLATALKESSNRAEISEARDLMAQRLNLYEDTVSSPAVLTRWVAGLTERKLGNATAAEFLLEEALEGAYKLKRSAEVAAIAADLGMTAPNPRNIKALVEGLGVEANGPRACVAAAATAAAPFVLPAWLHDGLKRGLQSLYEAAAAKNSDLRRIISECMALRGVAESLEGRVIPAL